MLHKNILKQSLTFSALAVLYIVLITAFMRNASHLFESDQKSVIGPIVFLLMFVISAAVMGLLIFGKPIMLYMDGKKRESIELVACTTACLIMFAILLSAVAAVSRFVFSLSL